MIAYETLLDAARRHFNRVASSPNFTRDARHKALELERECGRELDCFNAGNPLRALLNASALCGDNENYTGPDPDEEEVLYG